MRTKLTALLVAGVLASTVGLMVASGLAATDTIPVRWKNCTNVNKRYPHGVGKLRARDKTSGTPVTNFYRSTAKYLIAMSHNRGLDRDKDGIACEKA